MMFPLTVVEIEQMSYRQMLHMRRYAPAGHLAFVPGNKLSQAFSDRFKQLESELSLKQLATISDEVGQWEEDLPDEQDCLLDDLESD